MLCNLQLEEAFADQKRAEEQARLEEEKRRERERMEEMKKQEQQRLLEVMLFAKFHCCGGWRGLILASNMNVSFLPIPCAFN